MAASGCWPRCSVNFLFSKNCSPIAPMRDRFSIPRSKSPAQPQNRNRPTRRSRQRVRAIAQALDCRTHDRLAEPLPPTGQGLGEPQSQRSRFSQTRFHPAHVAKAMQSLNKSPDGLSGEVANEARILFAMDPPCLFIAVEGVDHQLAQPLIGRVSVIARRPE
jgi:hypothetical protein